MTEHPAATPDERPPPSRPATRPPWRERPAIWWAAAASARRRLPMPTVLPTPVSTPWRDEQLQQRDQEISRLRQVFELHQHPHLVAIRLREHEIRELDVQLEELRQSLRQLRTAGPPDLTERHPGDEGQPDNVVAARRSAERRRRMAPIRRQLRQTLARRRQATEELGQLQARLFVQRRHCALAAQEADHHCRVRLAYHDQVLLSLHLDADLLAEQLDRSGGGMPAWVQEWLSEGPEEAA